MSRSHEVGNSNEVANSLVGIHEQAQLRYNEVLQEPLRQAQEIGTADIVVGIPFYNEADTLPHVLEIATRGLPQFFPTAKSVLVAAGSPAGEGAIKAINEMPLNAKITLERITFLLKDDLLDGKGWSTRAIMDITEKLGADLVLLEADLQSRKSDTGTEGLAPDWIPLLLDPIKQDQMDLVVSKFNLHYLDLLTSADLKYPILNAIYGCPVHGTMGALRGISHDLLRTYTKRARRSWHNGFGGYGIDAWLITEAITNGARICQANLGIKIRKISGGKSELVFRQVAKTLVEQIVKDRKWHEQPGIIRNSPLVKPLPVFGVQKLHQPDTVEIAGNCHRGGDHNVHSDRRKRYLSQAGDGYGGREADGYDRHVSRFVAASSHNIDNRFCLRIRRWCDTDLLSQEENGQRHSLWPVSGDGRAVVPPVWRSPLDMVSAHNRIGLT